MASPIVQNQNPAPSSTGNRGDGALYLEVVDTDGDLDASTVQLWVNGTLAFSGSSAAEGFTGSRGTVANGYSYSFTPGTPLPVGTQTIRVRAEDNVGNVLDTEYIFTTSSFLDSVDVAVVQTIGGAKIIATGLFTKDSPLEVYLGPLGTVADPPCYGGSNKGYSPTSEDGVTVEFWTPPLDKGAASVTIVDGASTLGGLSSLVVAERSWPHKGFDHRRRMQPWTAVGGRRLKLEDLE